MERVSKLTALVCGILFIALSICHSYILVVQTDDFIYRRETGQLVEGQEAQCWSAIDRRTGERHQFLFPGPGRLVYQGTEYSYQVSCSLQESELTLHSSPDFSYTIVYSQGNWFASGTVSLEKMKLAAFLSQVISIHTGIYFCNAKLIGGLFASLFFLLFGLLQLGMKKPISLGRYSHWRPLFSLARDWTVEDTDQQKLDKARAGGGILIGLSLLTFVVSWNLLP